MEVHYPAPTSVLGMRRIALKIAYDGTLFHGQARQPGVPTVEGEILAALARARIVRDARVARFQSASRTDRGVSALGNVVAFHTGLAAQAVGRAFNAKARGVWAWAAADVTEDFNARRALSRWYRYTVTLDHDPGRLQEALRLFEGEHDFRNFTRDRERTIVRIDSATATRTDAAVVMDLRARSFRWNLVRRIVAASLQFESRTRTLFDLERALRPRTRADFGLAPAEPLVLVDVSYDIPFEPLTDPTTLARVRAFWEDRSRASGFARDLLSRFERA